MAKLKDEQFAALLNGDRSISDVEEFDEIEINYENLDEILLAVPNIVADSDNLENILVTEDLLTNNPEILATTIEEFSEPIYEQQIIEHPKWEKVVWDDPDNLWKGKLPKAHFV